jgi:hypothetical protein
LRQPLQRAARQPSLAARGVEVPSTTSKAAKTLEGRVAEKAQHAERKLFEYIKGKDSNQILKMMDTVEGVRKLKRALSLTENGDKLFKEIARYKLSEMIDKKMTGIPVKKFFAEDKGFF